MKRTITFDEHSSKRSKASDSHHKSKQYARTSSSSVPASIRAYVKKSIINDKEIKHYLSSYFAQSCQVGVSGAHDPFNLEIVPNITQGVADNQRVGDQLRVRKVEFKLLFRLLPYQVTTNPVVSPVAVRVMLVKVKFTNSGTYSNTNITTALFSASGAAVGFQGNQTDMLLEVDDGNYKICYDKVFTLGTTVQVASSSGVPDNNKAQKLLTINATKFYKNVLQYDFGTTACTNDNLWLIVQPVMCNITGSSTGYTPIDMDANLHMAYSDA